MEDVTDDSLISIKDTKCTVNEANSSEIISEQGKRLVSLIVRIIVNATIRECYEEGDQVS
jgi:hypothetical protein